ncbi:hypothetical protein SCARR_05355 [Pontiella sulfatireligans]|uniref:Uncharacterized protein n=1 Tax=Pontiella sulfatireligans TaxID=2750658 RepID=A0A6C2USL2_9BACT|nr:hypothetical protein SCARR_05355 [Pontiella sulfatireligans]
MRLAGTVRLINRNQLVTFAIKHPVVTHKITTRLTNTASAVTVGKERPLTLQFLNVRGL